MPKQTTKLKLTAEWVFDNEDTWNLCVNNISLAEIQMSKTYGLMFYARVGTHVASSDFVMESKTFCGDKLEAAKKWVEQQLNSEEGTV